MLSRLLEMEFQLYQLKKTIVCSLLQGMEYQAGLGAR